MRFLLLLTLLGALTSGCQKAATPPMLLAPDALPLNHEQSYYSKVTPELGYSDDNIKREKPKPTEELPFELGFLETAMQARPPAKGNFSANAIGARGGGTLLYALHYSGVAHNPFAKIVESDLSEAQVVSLVREHYAKRQIIEWKRASWFYPRGKGMLDGYAEYEVEIPEQKLIVHFHRRISLSSEGLDSAWQISGAKLK